MKIYVTSKNSGPSWEHEQKSIVYIGSSLEIAVENVEDFRRYEVGRDKFPTRYPYLYSAIPQYMNRRMVKFYTADGWWYSIVSIDIEPDTKY